MSHDNVPHRSTAGLSSRQYEIIRLAAQGYTNRAIAATLGISEPTVKTHLSRILARLNVSSRTEAAVWLERQGNESSDSRGSLLHDPE